MGGIKGSLVAPTDDPNILHLSLMIRNAFPATPVPESFEVALQGLGDDYGRLRVIASLNMPWRQASKAEIDRCGPDLLFHISAEGLCYYLPAFLLNFLEHREFGWFEEGLIPATCGFEDVVDCFAGSAVYGLTNEASRKYFSRVAFIREKLTSEQRECVAKYIEIAETHEAKELPPEFLHLLKKYTDFWRNG